MSLLYADQPRQEPEPPPGPGRERIALIAGGLAAGAAAIAAAARLVPSSDRLDDAGSAWGTDKDAPSAARVVDGPSTTTPVAAASTSDSATPPDGESAPEQSYEPPPGSSEDGSSTSFGTDLEPPPSPGTGTGQRTVAADPSPPPAPDPTTPTVPPTTSAPDGTTASTTTSTTTTTTTLPPPLFDLAHARTVAARATFGTTPAVLAEIETIGLAEWIDQQLEPAGIDDPDAEAAVAGYARLSQSPAQILAADARSEADAQVYWATVARSLVSRRQLLEVMVQFWREHFTVVTGGEYRVSHDRYLREHGLGRFEDLLLASAHDPAMLYYLDNARSNANRSGGVNENYGRELLELHTLGIIDGSPAYTEADIRGAAEVMSGWSVESGVGFTYREDYHFGGPVSLLGGAWSTPGRSGTAGYDDGRSLLSFLAHHPSTARYLAWKLCRFFVAEDPPGSIVDAAAATYLATGTDIAATLRTVLTSQEMRQSSRQRAKRGYEWVLSALRTAGASVATGGEWNRYDSRHVPGLLRLAGHELYGWSTPDGYPVENEWWMSSWGLYQRWYEGRRLVDAGDPGRIVVDSGAMLPVDPQPAAAWVADLGRRICGLDLTDAEVGACVAFLGVAADTEIDAAAVGDPGDIIGLVISMPTFQARG